VGLLKGTWGSLRYALGHPVARALVIGLGFGVLFAAVDDVALVFLAREDLHAGAVGYGVLVSAYGIRFALVDLTSARATLVIGGSGVLVLLVALVAVVLFPWCCSEVSDGVRWMLEQVAVSCRAGWVVVRLSTGISWSDSRLARTMSGSRGSLGRASDQARCRGAFGRWLRMRFIRAHLPAARVAGGAP
jgi:hypothetical protein